MNGTQKIRILSNSAKFSAGRPLLPAYNFSATMTSINRLWAVASVNFLAIQSFKIICSVCQTDGQTDRQKCYSSMAACMAVLC